MTESLNDDYDSPWKEALERYFPEFLALLFPWVPAAIDWSSGYMSSSTKSSSRWCAMPSWAGATPTSSSSLLYERGYTRKQVLELFRVLDWMLRLPERWGCALRFRFPIRKLLDLQARWDELEADPSPVALVVMAHLKGQESKEGPTRKGWKMRLVRLLYQRGYSREDILGLFRVMDWLL